MQSTTNQKPRKLVLRKKTVTVLNQPGQNPALFTEDLAGTTTSKVTSTVPFCKAGGR